VSATLAFMITVAYSAVGNAVLYVLLRRRGVAFRFVWSGTPGYLYRVCRRSTPPLPRALTGFALSTYIAFILVIPAGIWFAASLQ
jgi:hypothetical protein